MEQLSLKIHCWSSELGIKKLSLLLQQWPQDTGMLLWKILCLLEPISSDSVTYTQ